MHVSLNYPIFRFFTPTNPGPFISSGRFQSFCRQFIFKSVFFVAILKTATNPFKYIFIKVVKNFDNFDTLKPMLTSRINELLFSLRFLCIFLLQLLVYSKFSILRMKTQYNETQYASSIKSSINNDIWNIWLWAKRHTNRIFLHFPAYLPYKKSLR